MWLFHIVVCCLKIKFFSFDRNVNSTKKLYYFNNTHYFGGSQNNYNMNFLWFILIGGFAGWLAGQIMRGKGFGIFGNIIIGILGAVIGGWLFGVLGLQVANNLIGALLTATAGAIVAIFIGRLLSS